MAIPRTQSASGSQFRNLMRMQMPMAPDSVETLRALEANVAAAMAEAPLDLGLINNRSRRRLPSKKVN